MSAAMMVVKTALLGTFVRVLVEDAGLGQPGHQLWHGWLRRDGQRQFGPGQGGRGRPHIGGDLLFESLQDTSAYDSKQTSASVTIGVVVG